MMIILLKASLITAILWGFYKAILEKESFFALNRIYLMGCLLMAFILPFIALPSLVDHQGVVTDLLTPTLVKKDQSTNNTEIFDQKEGLSIEEEKPFIDTSTEENEVGLAPNTRSKFGSLGIFFWLAGIYLFGLLVLLIHILAQVLITWIKAIKHPDKIEDTGCIILNMDKEIEPCSFFRYIFVNPSSYEYETYEQILTHEKIHVKYWHSIDLLIAEISVAILWFNPFVWLLRREVEKNIEYQTDDLLVNEAKDQKEEYQLNLLKIATYNKPLTITTNYNQSLIKQRILKMNSKKSNPYSYWKYAFLAPLIFTTLLIINKPNSATAQTMTSISLIDSEDNEDTNTKESAELISNDCQALLRAVKNNNIEEVKKLLQETNPNCTFYDDGEPRSALVAAARKGYLDIGKLIIEAGGKVEFHASGDESPLMAAAAYGHVAFVNYLLGQNAKVDAIIDGNGTALINAVRGGHHEIAQILLEKGADPYKNVPGDEYAMYHARVSKDKKMIDLLKRYDNR